MTIKKENIENNNLEEDNLFEHYKIFADKGQTPLRIDKFLMHRIENASRTKIQSAANVGSILVNGICVKPNYKVKPLDIISIVLPTPPRDTEVYPENIPLDIVYEDNDLLIVNKKAGMVVHPGYNNYTGTLVNALVYHFNSLPTQNGNFRPGLVHRIDKDTSGILVVSKNENSMAFLAKQFFEHTIERNYYALAWGNIEKNSFTISNYLNRDPKDRRKSKCFENEEDGKIAITHVEVITRYGFCSLLKCTLETGRTHQIRAHLAHIGHPLFNDEMYGGATIKSNSKHPKFNQFILNCFELMPRQALHAKNLGFIHPSTNKKIFFDSELPSDFQNVLNKFDIYSK